MVRKSKKVVEISIAAGFVFAIGALMVLACAKGGAPNMSYAPGQPMFQESLDPNHNTEAYARIDENPFMQVADKPRSTFSVDVDTASYSNMRRFLNDGRLPPKDAVRIEELINYFSYDYPAPTGQDPFSVNAEVSACPWNAEHKLVRIGLQGRRMDTGELPARNLVFLLDVSGSMNSPDKLPLLKAAMKLLVEGLSERDHVAITVYAGASGLVLPSTPGSERHRILEALDHLQAGGSTNGGAGIQLAYSVARDQFRRNGINRVILATDGDFNVGTTSDGALTRLIEKEREGGVFLTVLGLGTGNLKDSTMERLANRGNGNYAYIDSLAEARKVLVTEAGATLVTIAKDVKIQVEFNPTRVQAYRLIGYENRLLADRDFNDDSKDAGEIGAGHNVTALYEIVPGPAKEISAEVDTLKYQTHRDISAAARSGELMTIKLRYKAPDEDESKLMLGTIEDALNPIASATDSHRWAAAVAAFGMQLRDSKHKGTVGWGLIDTLARGSSTRDPFGYRKEFLGLLERARSLGDR